MISHFNMKSVILILIDAYLSWRFILLNFCSKHTLTLINTYNFCF